MGLVAKRMAAWLACLAVLAGMIITMPTVSAADEIIVRLSGGGYTQTGSWLDSTVSGNEGGKTKYAVNTATASWTPVLPDSAMYRVYVYNVVYAGSTTKAQFEIVHNGKTDLAEPLDQSTGTSGWVEIGTYDFIADGDECVRITAAPGVTTRISDVKFEYVAPMAGGTSSGSGYLDVDGTEYEQAVTLLKALGIMEGESALEFGLEGTVTRAEMAHYIARALNAPPDPAPVDRVFSDVSEDYWAAAEIHFVTSLGIVQGYSDGSFAPEDPVTYEQAVKMIVSMLGYEVYANYKGGYPAGFLAVASEKRIIRDEMEPLTQPISRGTLAKLLFYALHVDLMVQTVYGENEVEYTTVPGRTILTEKQNVVHDQGIVNATSFTKLNTADSDLELDEVEIDKVVYNVGTTNVRSYLGQCVEFYCRVDEEQEERTVIYCTVQEDVSELIKIDAKDILGFAQNTYEYRDVTSDDTTRRAMLDSNPSVLYNGVYTDAYTDADFWPEEGYVELIDANGDSLYETVVIYDMDNRVAQGVNLASNRVYFKYGRPALELDVEDDDMTIELTRNGAPSDLAGIRENNVLSVLESKDGMHFRVMITTKKVNGAISEIKGEDKVVIDDEEYEISKSYQDACKANGALPFEPGDEGQFLLDVNGRIAGFVATVSVQLYGYLADTGLTNSMDPVVLFKIYSERGEMLTVPGTERIKLGKWMGDGALVEKKYEGADILPELGAVNGQKCKRQLIRFEMTPDFEVKAIYLALDATDEAAYPKGYATNAFAQNRTSNQGTTTIKYMLGSNSFQQQYGMDGETVIFAIPKEENRDDYKSYRLLSSSVLKDQEAYPVEIYDTNSLKVCRVAVIYGGIDSNLGSTFSDPWKTAVVQSVSSAVDKDGNEILKINTLESGVERAFYDNGEAQEHSNIAAGGTTETDYYDPANPKPLASLEAGDVIMCYPDEDGFISKYRVLFQTSEITDDFRNSRMKMGSTFNYKTDYAFSGLSTHFGKIAEVSGNVYTMRLRAKHTNGDRIVEEDELASATDESTWDVYFHSYSRPSVYICNRASGTVRAGTVEDITMGATALVHHNGAYTRTVVIYE